MCRWTLSAAALAAIVAFVGGCGGSSSKTSSSPGSSASTTRTSQTSQSAAQFKAAVAPVLKQFKNASHRTGVALQHANTQSDAQLATTFQQLAATWGAALTHFESLHPPPSLTAAYHRLKGQVSNVKSDLKTVASAARGHEAGAAKAAATKLIDDILSAKATSASLSSGTA
jgi:hypothetical protein